jgi:glycerate kinase
VGRVADPGSVAGPVAVLETARACGLTLVPEGCRNPLRTSTFGVGQMIADALRHGCRDFVIGLGGSATNDAGIGMLAALGWRFLDRDGAELPPVGALLGAVVTIDDSSVDPALVAVGKGIRFTAACDVDTPFCGPEGAAAVFAPQKGADAAAVARLDAGMASFAAVIERYTGVDVRRIPGAGAAGGLGGALRAFLGAELKPGADLVLDAVGFDAFAAGADLVITGEGRLDAQTARGKLPYCVLRRATTLGIPTLALAGQFGQGFDALANEKGSGIAAGDPAGRESLRFAEVLCVTPPGMSLETAMQPAVARQNVREAVRMWMSVRTIVGRGGGIVFARGAVADSVGS